MIEQNKPKPSFPVSVLLQSLETSSLEVANLKVTISIRQGTAGKSKGHKLIHEMKAKPRALLHDTHALRALARSCVCNLGELSK